jgi:hypothetical protein
MLPSQTEFDALIAKLQTQKTELSEIDAKEDLPLETDGDKAFFVHHVAALANNIVPSYLIIGIQDKSWEIKGLRDESPLKQSDQTKNKMNQILENKLDPQLAIGYRTYEYEGKTLGLGVIEGSQAPYLIAIGDGRFGGRRTKGEPSYLYRGAIYIRHGDSTVIANRQSRILEIINQTRVSVASEPDEFLVKNNYVDVDSDEYGKNPLTSNLVEITYSMDSERLYDKHDAKSWISFVFSPLERHCKIDTVSLGDKLQPDKLIGREGEWYQDLPRPISDMIFYGKNTPRSYFGSWFPTDRKSPPEYTHVISILPTGHIQIAVTYPLFYEREFDGINVRFFAFVNLIGYFWQLIYLVRAIYKDSGYHGITSVLVNLIGSSSTYLFDLTKGPNKKWISFGDWQYTPTLKDQSHEKAIRIERKINLTDVTDSELETMVRDIACELGNYFGQESPKCFTPDTNEFPANDYVNVNSK